MIRRLAHAAMVILSVAAAVLIVQTPAHAATALSVTYVHSGGTGAIAAKVTGSITWLNRSVQINNPALYVKAGECAQVVFDGWAGLPQEDILIASRTEGWCNIGGPSRYESIAAYGAPIVLDGSVYGPGGIQTITVSVEDLTHNGHETGQYSR